MKSISLFALNQLRGCHALSIHSRFDRGMNLLCGECLIYLGSRVLPFGIEIDNFDCVRDAVGVGFDDDVLYFSFLGKQEVKIDLSFVPISCDLHQGRISGIEWKIARIKECVSLKDVEPLFNYLGRGIGLTPSGDDFLVGLYCVSFCGLDLMGDLADVNFFDYTTKVSAQYLDFARRGRFNPDLILLLETLDSFIFDALLQDLLDIGYSSGADTLEGVLFGLVELNHYLKGI